MIYQHVYFRIGCSVQLIIYVLATFLNMSAATQRQISDLFSELLFLHSRHIDSLSSIASSNFSKIEIVPNWFLLILLVNFSLFVPFELLLGRYLYVYFCHV